MQIFEEEKAEMSAALLRRREVALTLVNHSTVAVILSPCELN